MKRLLRLEWLLGALLLWATACPAAQGIQGAFGQTLGQRFDPAKSVDSGMTRDDMWFEFQVERTLPFLKNFRALVTPLGYRIYGIQADDTAADRPVCLQWVRGLAATVAEKYLPMAGVRMVSSEAEDLFRVDQASERRRITLACNASGQLLVIYEDLALKDRAAAEQQTWNHLVDTAQSDSAADALPRLQTLADEGHAQAQLLLALAYRRGRGVKADDTIAEAYYLKAAQSGLLDAQYNLGTFYLQRENHAKALPWLRAAAERGRTTAQFNLAQLLLKSKTPADDAEALRWFVRAANSGHVDAQYNSCHMYSAGDGAARSEIDAYKWCDIAAAAGHQKARENRDFIAQRMSAEQVGRAKLLSTQWQSAHPKIAARS